MESLPLYLLETGICLIVLYGGFWLLLKRDTFFGVNRMYLLSAVFLSFIIPMISLSSVPQEAMIYADAMQAIIVEADRIEYTVRNSLSSFEIIAVIYITGVIIFLMRFAIQMLQLRFLLIKNKVNKVGGYKLIFADGKFSPFSFFNMIFLDNSFEFNSDSEQIIAHEKAHADKFHSVDVIILEILTIFQWFNPIVWLYKKSIKEIHEYQADEGVIRLGYDKINYQELILKQISGADLFRFTNKFNYSTIKRRIVMMTKLKSQRIAVFKLLLVLPISALLVLAFSCTENDTDELFTANTVFDEDGTQEIIPDEYPKFSGGSDAQAKNLKANMKTPQEFLERGIPGKVVVRFEVMKDGSIQNARFSQSLEIGKKWTKEKLGYGCDDEALNFVMNMPKWEPAIFSGEAINHPHSMIFLFGDKAMKSKWNEFYKDKDNWIESKVANVYDSKIFPKGKGIHYETPEFPGGKNKMLEYLGKNIKYPKEARKNGIEGTVHVVFLIKTNGSISKVRVSQSIGYGCDEEAIRVIKSMPNWDLHNDEIQKTEVEMKIPITFKLHQSNKDEKNKIETKVRYAQKKRTELMDIDKMPIIDQKSLANSIKYPNEARIKDISGTVRIKALVGKDGLVKKAEIKDSDNEIFNDNAISAVKKAKFTPAEKDGKSIEAWVEIPIKYVLK